MDRNISVFIGNEELDLYGDETIQITSTVKNLRDISSVFTDFSETFVIPASARNNKILGFYFVPESSVAFDSRVKAAGRIEVGTVPFKVGRIGLLSVQMQGNAPVSYTINFVGNVSKINELLGDDRLRDLDLSAFDHPRTESSASTGLQIGLFGGDVIYPLTSYSQLFYDGDPDSPATALNGNTDNPAVNIAAGTFTSGTENRGVYWQDLKPAIKIFKIIEAIEAKYGITFSRDFLNDTGIISDLYIWLSTGVDRIPVIGALSIIEHNFRDPLAAETYWDLSTNTWTQANMWGTSGAPVLNETNRMKMAITITPAAGFEDVPYDLYYQVDSSAPELVTTTGSISGTKTRTAFYVAGDDAAATRVMTLMISSKDVFDYDVGVVSEYQEWRIDGSAPDWVTLPQGTESDITSATGQTSAAPNTSISGNMPDITVLDFLNGIISAFNLVVLPQTESDFFVDTLDAWYNAGSIIDITKFTEASDFGINRGIVYERLNFKFSENDTLLIRQREEITGDLYGDLEIEFTDDQGEKLDGGVFDVSLPFSQVVYERLADNTTGALTQVCYAPMLNSELDAEAAGVHIFYSRLVSPLAETSRFFIRNEDPNAPATVTLYRRMSHINEAFTNAFIFDDEIDEFTGEQVANTLFSNYWQDYINDTFNKGRRVFNFRARLPLQTIQGLQLNDRLIIDGRRYVINQLVTNLTTGFTELELLNDIF